MNRTPASVPAPDPAPVNDTTDGVPGEAPRLHRRFDRMARLVGDAGMDRLRHAHAMVIGLGGVGSWAAEALVRSGVGTITLVDFDLVCVTNANRQLHAMRGTTGKPKVAVMAERLSTINPACEVLAERTFYGAHSSPGLLDRHPDVVIDAIDNITAKAHLIATCRDRSIEVVVSGGASGRRDPTAVRERDLAAVRDDPFLAATRKALRKEYEFPARGPWGITAVHSLELPADPIPLDYDGDEGFKCVCPQGQNGQHDCERRRLIYGTAGFVTGAFGFACASAAVRTVLG